MITYGMKKKMVIIKSEGVMLISMACIFLVFGSVSAHTFGQIQGASARRGVPVELHQQNDRVCGASLFLADGPSEATRAADGVDYCRELVIVDKSVLADLSDFSFSAVLTGLVQEASATQQITDEEVIAYFESWAKTWNEQPAVGGRGVLGRKRVTEMLQDAGPANIALIGVVNRIDLKEPEGRLVFQVLNSTGGPLELTIIAEFKLPVLGNGTETLRQDWARRWHDLGKPELTRQEYVATLKAVVGEFAQTGNLQRIRTNEQLALPSWEMRQYERGQNGLLLSPLPKTPGEHIRTEVEGRNWLAGFLSWAEVKEGFATGDHAFIEVSPEWQGRLGLIAQFPLDNAEKLAWDLPAVVDQKDIFLFSFNTCNGCHHDMLMGNALTREVPRNNAQHLAIPSAGKFARLSRFLSGEISVAAIMPECNKNQSAPGCPIKRNDLIWNEVDYRSSWLMHWARPPVADAAHTAKSSDLEPARETETVVPLFYRYH